ncbi:dedicator of cytokinesis protein 3-like [Pollicipes pollicipes]|uniref:dedicator of cytokinesis protein 3-like n=1 Tax=Pollicipes pollicipes TaxID=41117 RepID=UPI0018853060|nr:dedicator of cytokinesis protein 3-like [Pollicipes pollicipes]
MVTMWKKREDGRLGVAVYGWGGGVRHGLPLSVGETVHILEECDGWLRGHTVRNKTQRGIFPASYIRLKPCLVDGDGPQERIVPVEEAVVTEVTQVLREWSDRWKQLYIGRETLEVSALWKVMHELLDWRRQLITGTLTQDQTRELRVKVTAKVDWGNRRLGLDLVPRLDGCMVDPEAISVVALHRVHSQSLETSQGMSVRGTLRKRKTSRPTAHSHNLYASLREFGYVTGDDVELYFSLYDADKAKFVSERFLVLISREGQSNFYNKPQNNTSVVFTDLGDIESAPQLYLVLHALRLGRMLPSESSKRGASQRFRRPLGCAVLNVHDVLASRPAAADAERELSLRLQQTEERDFSQLHEMIIRQASRCSPLSASANYGVLLSLRLLNGSQAQVMRDHPLLLKHAAIARKLGFPDIIMPGDIRNDLYLTLDRGEFERGGKSTGKNIEVCVSVVRSDGRVLEDCIVSASGQAGSRTFTSTVLYHNNAPRWGETLRLAVPIESFSGAHVRLEYSHCSSAKDRAERKLFAFSFACLMDQEGATIGDGPRELCVYKCEDRNKLLNPASYLGLPWHAAQVREPAGGNHHFSRSGREWAWVRTLLCSTKLTQNGDLLSLLKWKQNPDKIVDTLTRIMKLKGEEVMKFLQDVLDSLFAMFSADDGNSTQHSGLVFQVLVSIFSHLRDSRFEHFRPVLDAYINGHFAAALVYKGLVSCVRHYAEQVTTSERQQPLLKCFGTLELVFQFVARSRLLFGRQSVGDSEDGFRADLAELFNVFNRTLASTGAEATVGTQVALLSSVPAVCEQLRAILPDAELACRLSLLLEALPRDPPPAVTQAKLKAMQAAAGSPLFLDGESRRLLLQTMCKHLQYHISHRQEVRLSTDLLGDVLDLLHQLQSDDPGLDLSRDVEIVSAYLVDTLVRSVLSLESAPRRTGGGQCGRLVAALATLLRLMTHQHHRHLWDEMADDDQLAQFLLRLMALFRELITEQMYPQDWCVMKMTVNKLILTTLGELSIALRDRFLAGNRFNQLLWHSYLTLSVTFVTQPELQLESFSEVKRDKLLQKYQDMRLLMGFELLAMWGLLGEHKSQFVPALVGPLLELTLIPALELRTATLPVFYDLIEVEQVTRGSFRQVEMELIDKLDILVSEDKGDDEYRRLFQTILMMEVERRAPSWHEAGVAFVSSVTRLLERLLDYRQVMDGEENRDKRISCTVNLLNFYKSEVNRAEMYQRYIYKLHDLHVSAENYVEAALTLRLHADQLEWTTRVLHADLRYPVQCEWQRKEQLLNQMVDYLDRGKCWEAGIPLLKELAEQYENRVFDYGKLSEVLKSMARFYDQILTQLRPEPEYFRVGFYGQRFPLFVRNKVFVYRGLEYERIGAFTQRLQTEFPTAQLMTTLAPPDDNLMNSPAQFIQICHVRPVARDVSSLPGVEVPARIRAFYLVNGIDTFQFDRPVHRGVVDKENEFKSLWLERTTLEIEAPLPGILRWFPVVSARRELISPIRHGCETVSAANRQLRQLIAQYTPPAADVNISPLSMRLQGIIDAAVNGGIANFKDAFFTAEFPAQNPDMAPHVPQLKGLIQEQLSILEHGLTLHGQLAPANVQPLHRRLRQCLRELRQGAAASCLAGGDDSPGAGRFSRQGSRRRSVGADSKASILSTPLPPVPTERRPASGSCRSSRSSTSSCSVFGPLPDEDEDEVEGYSRPSEWGDLADLGGRGSISSRASGGSRRHDYILLTVGKGDEEPPERPPKRFSEPRAFADGCSRPASRQSHVSIIDTSLPPLPPKPPEKRHTSSVSSVVYGGGPEHRPSLPARLTKKVSAPAILSGDSAAVSCPPTPPPLPPRLAGWQGGVDPSGDLLEPPDFEAPPPPDHESPLRLSLGFDDSDSASYKILQPDKLRRFADEANYKLVVTPGRICRRVAAAGERETEA